MNTTEKIPINRLNLLNRLSLDDYIDLIGKTNYKKYEIKEHFNMIKDYVKDMIKTKGEMKKLYKHSEASDKGRLYGNNSIQGLDSIIRGYLFRNITSDIDQVNSHPVLLRYISKINKIRCPILEEYINNRDEILEDLKSEGVEDPKTLILKIVNSSQSPRKYKSVFIKNLINEVKVIRDNLKKIIEYGELFEEAKTIKPLNVMGSFINRVLCYYENEVLQIMINHLNKKHYEIACLSFDGLLIYGNEYDNMSLINELEKEINEKFNGMEMRLKYKQHSNIITDDYLESLDEPEEEYPELSEHDMAMLVLKKHPHFKNCKETLYVFDKQTGLWTDNKSKHYAIVYDNLYDEVGSKVLTAMKLKSICIHISSETIEENWLSDNANSSLGKILFSNGYFDGDEGECGKFYTEFNPDIVFMNKIYMDLPAEIDEQYRESVLDRFFYKPLGKEVSDYYIQNLSRSMMGQLLKKLFFCLGDGNTGKSTLTKALQSSFGEYVGTFNAECFNHKDTSQDEAQLMRWALLMRFKRIIFSNELSKKGKLNGNMMKKVSSGGDTLVGRTHGSEETPFTPHFIANIFANDINEITPYDDALQNRIRVIPYTKIYVDENPDENQLLKDHNIEKEMLTIKFKQTFIRIILDSFINFRLNGEIKEPDAVLSARTEWVSQDANVIQTFLESFDITNDEKDYIKYADIKDWIKDNEIGISDMKFTMELKKYCSKNKLDNVYNKQKKIDGKNSKCWFGIKY